MQQENFAAHAHGMRRLDFSLAPFLVIAVAESVN